MLGSSLPPNPRGALATGCGCILGAVAWLQLHRGAFAGGFLRHSGRFPRTFLVASESDVRQ